MNDPHPSRGVRRDSPRGFHRLPAELDIPGREPAFPGLAVLLDPERFSGLLRLHAGHDPGPGRLVDLRYRPGAECLATYVFAAGDGDVWVHARALGADVRPTAPDMEAGRRSALGFRRMTWPDHGLDVRVFPCDDGLPGLQAVDDDAERAELLAEVLPEHPAAALTLRTVSYEPERRWLGAVESDGRPVAALRIHPAQAFPQARWNAESLHDGEGLRVPRLLGRSRRHCATAVAWAAGRAFAQALLDRSLHRVEVEGVGAALAELHAQEAGPLPHCPPAGGAPAVRALAGTIELVLPRCAPRVRRLADRLVRKLVEAPPGDRPVHGSLGPGKLLLQGGARVVLLDLDRACQGPPARDLGALVGHLERAAVAGEIEPRRASWAAEALLTGYGRTAARPPRRGEVTLYSAVTLLELALRPFRRLLPEWPDQTVALLERAEAVLDR